MTFDHSDTFLLFACKKSLGVVSLKQEKPELKELKNWAGNNFSLLCLGSQPQVVIAGLQNGQVISFKTIEKAATKTMNPGNSEMDFAFDTILMDQHKGPCGCIWPTKQVKGFLTAGFDGSIIQWDSFLNRVHKFEIQAEFPFKISSLKIKSICEDPLTGEIILGNKAGDIFELNLSEKVHKNTVLMKGHMDHLTGLDSIPGRSEIATVGKDGYLVIRDYEKKKQKLALKLEFEGSKLAANLEGNHIAVGFTNGAVHIVDINNTAILLKLFDHKSKICILKFSSTMHNYLMASASEDGRIIFYRADFKYLKIAIIENIKAPPLSLDFSEDARAVQIVNQNFTLNYFTTEDHSMEEERLKDSSTKRKNAIAEEFKNELWQTWTSPFGWSVQGLLKDKEFISKFSCLQRSPNKKFLAVGFLDGIIRFYRYPCLGDDPAFLEYKVHSGAVSAIIFVQDTNSMFSIGKTERNVVHWKLSMVDDTYLPSFRFQEPPAIIPKEQSENTMIPLTTRDRKKIKNTEFDNLSLRLAEAPDQNLELKHVFGFSHDLVSNISRFTAINSVVYVSGNKAIVEELGKDNNLQSFFVHHQENITCLDLNKSKEIVATADSSGDIFVWHYQTKAILGHLKASQPEGVSKIKFSAESSKLLAINRDKNQTLDVFDHTNKRLLLSVKLHEGPVHSISFSNDEEFITVTPDRIRFWHFKGVNLTSTIGDWRPLQATEEEIQAEKKDKNNEPEYLTVGMYAFTSNLCLTGTSKGRIYLWENKTFKSIVKFPSPIAISKMICYKNILYVGGSDGVVTSLVETESKLIIDKPVKIALPQSLSKFAIRSLDIASSGPFLFALIGTDTGKLFVSEQLDENENKKKSNSPMLSPTKENPNYAPKGFNFVTQSHSGTTITSLAAHQFLPFFVTSGDDGRIFLWNSTKKQVENIFEQKEKNDSFFTNIDWSADGEYIVATTNKGYLYVFDKMLVLVTKISLLPDSIVEGILIPFLGKKDLIEKQKSLPLSPSEEQKDVKTTALKISNSPYIIAVALTIEGIHDLHIFDFNSKKKELVYRQALDGQLNTVCRYMDWSHDGSYLACSLDSYEQKFFEITIKECTLTSFSSVKDKLWLSWTQPLGPTVQGIKLDDNEIRFNPVCRSFKYLPRAKDYELEYDGKPVNLLLAAGDREGMVGLYRFPSVHPNSDAKRYKAVASKMAHLRIFGNDEFVVAVGENSNSIVLYETDFKNNNKAPDDIGEILKSEEVAKPSIQAEILPRLSVKRVVESGTIEQKQKLEEKNLMNYIIFPTNYLKPPINSHLPPKLTLEPVYAFGFRAKDTRDNLKYLDKHEIVYPTASLVVIHDSSTNKQKFFMEHTADVTCISVKPLDRLIASGDLASPPTIHVWSADSLSSIRKFKLEGQSGLMKVQFSPDGPYLVALGTDEHSTISVINYETSEVLFTVPGDGKSQRVYDMRWVSNFDFVTVGVNHVKSWKIENHRLTDSRGRLDYKTGQRRIISCALNKRDFLGGTTNGDLLIWRKGQVATDHPQLFSVFNNSDTCNSIEMICVSDHK
jgi:WD40 repeat protein